MRLFTRLIAFIAMVLVAPLAAQAKVQISIDLSSQRMNVQSGAGESYSWPISSARAGYYTPRGAFRPTSLQTMHRSKKYHNSPMPHSIFFSGGYAIHGTYAVRALGRPASHGCIRLSPANAATLFSMVRSEGAVIQIYGGSGARHYAHARPHKKVQFAQRRNAHRSALGYAPNQHQKVQRIFNKVLLD
jgi:hypothetical protein